MQTYFRKCGTVQPDATGPGLANLGAVSPHMDARAGIYKKFNRNIIICAIIGHTALKCPQVMHRAVNDTRVLYAKCILATRPNLGIEKKSDRPPCKAIQTSNKLLHDSLKDVTAHDVEVTDTKRRILYTAKIYCTRREREKEREIKIQIQTTTITSADRQISAINFVSNRNRFNMVYLVLIFAAASTNLQHFSTTGTRRQINSVHANFEQVLLKILSQFAMATRGGSI